MGYDRPPPQFPGGFNALDVLPELRGRRLLEIAAAGDAVKLWCRACGRDVIFPPRSLREIASGHHQLTIETFVRVSKCSTCGAQETQASGWFTGPNDSEKEPTVRHAFYGGPFCPGRKP